MRLLEESIQDMIDVMNIALGKEVTKQTVVENKKKLVKPVFGNVVILTDDEFDTLVADLVF